MKKYFTLMVAALVVCSISNAQTTQETILERKALDSLTRTQLDQRASRSARREARKLEKEGWRVAPGQLPLDKQLDRSYAMYYEFEDNGFPKYIIGDAVSPGATYDAAKMQALELAKVNLAGLIQSEVTALVENTVANEQISSEAASAIVRTVQTSKDLIVQKIGRTITVVECYKTLPNKTVQVRVSLAYNVLMALEEAKAVVKAQLEEHGEDMQEQLEAILVPKEED